LLTIGLAFGCKKPYLPHIISSPGTFLVVEGVISSGIQSTVVKLSRSVNLSSAISANSVSGAVLTVESNQNDSYRLYETTAGTYVSDNIMLDNSKRYHLRIKTANNKEYLSDFGAVKINPPIDSIGYLIQSNGIQVYVNTHNPANNTRYYRWEYEETWRFHTRYPSNFTSDGKIIIPRPPNQQIYYCYSNDKSSSIILGSSAKLTQDIIYQAPITQVAANSEKIETKYSILVKQYALTSDAFNYWQSLKKNTEQLGSIFDAQPSNLKGNIQCLTDPSEFVIGYISVTNIQQKRVYINNSELPTSWLPDNPYDCRLDTFLYCRKNTKPCIDDVGMFLVPIGSPYLPVAPIFSGPVVIGYLGTGTQCTDCTTRGFTTPPGFWK
jgi:hypothetical protein